MSAVSLVWQLAQRDVSARYRQSWLGVFWLVATPVLMLAVYTLVFRHVLQVRWGDPAESDLAFAARVYAGLAVFTFFAECVNRAPTLVTEQPHLVKKVVFPLELLAWVGVAAAAVHLAVAAALLLALRALGLGGVPPSALALPLVWLPLLPLCLGLAWGLSAVGTYVRDVGPLVSMAMTALVFLSPVFFPVEALPAALRPWMALNPLATVMTLTREVVLAGRWPSAEGWGAWAMCLAGCGAVALAGRALFARLRPGFADVL